MTDVLRGNSNALRVVAGGKRRMRDMPDSKPARVCAAELAADMADLFAMALVRDCPLDSLPNPHSEITLDTATQFTLHELLCELRSLSWSDPDVALPAEALTVDHSPTDVSDADHRRALRWNGDGQLTLRTLFRGSVLRRPEAPMVSRLILHDRIVSDLQGPTAPPSAEATLPEWLRWCAAQNGAGLQMPCDATENPAPQSLSELAAFMLQTPPARPLFNGALDALSRGTPLDPGVACDAQGAEGWSSTRVLSLLSEAELRANKAARDTLVHQDRMARPTVTAARMSVYLNREEASMGADHDPMRQAARELALAAPMLLHWVSRANLAQRGAALGGQNLFLPLSDPQAIPAHPADLCGHVVVTAAMATVIKALFDTGARPQLQTPTLASADPDLAQACDQIVTNAALSRMVLGTHFASENATDMRLGEAISLQILRSALEADNRSASLELRSFDGCAIQLVTHPRVFGTGLCTLVINGEPHPWPQDRSSAPAAHLTAVV